MDSHLASFGFVLECLLFSFQNTAADDVVGMLALGLLLPVTAKVCIVHPVEKCIIASRAKWLVVSRTFAPLSHAPDMFELVMNVCLAEPVLCWACQ